MKQREIRHRERRLQGHGQQDHRANRDRRHDEPATPCQVAREPGEGKGRHDRAGPEGEIYVGQLAALPP